MPSTHHVPVERRPALKPFIALCLLLGGTAPLRSQIHITVPGPTVEWRNIMVPGMTPSWGSMYEWNTVTEEYDINPVTSQEPITPATSGEDWWYAHCNLYDANGIHIGYAAAGYNTVPNWGYVDDTNCFDRAPTTVDHGEFETAERRKGFNRTWLARFDLDGNMIWCKSYMPGYFWGIAQGADGNIVATGIAYANRQWHVPCPTPPDPESPCPLENPWPIHYNPGLEDPPVNVITLDCDNSFGPMPAMATIMKTDLSGQVIWQNFYGHDPELEYGWSGGGYGIAIKPAMVNGQPGFLAVCGGGGRPLVMKLDNDGHIVEPYSYELTDPAITAFGLPNIAGVAPMAMDIRLIGGKQRVAISGQVALNGGTSRSFLWYLDDIDGDAPFLTSLEAITSGTGLNMHNGLDHQQTTGVVLAEVDDEPVIAWPVLSNYSMGQGWGGVNAATLLVHRFDPAAQTPVWTANLGEVRAYDLQADGVFTSDGNLAFVSSRWAHPYHFTAPFGYTDLPPGVQSCINAAYPGANWSTTNLFNYWNTDAYVAKVRMADGELMWTTTFDSDPGVGHGCWPDDIRKQECMYKITEADDGGFVISGNTSHNFDDGYLAKLKSDCQSSLDYTVKPNQPGGLHVLATSETWSTDRNVAGVVHVQAGVTLTIGPNTTIRFADSDQMQWPTRLIVEPGGKLFMYESATLSAVQGCPNSMWDGGQIWGNYFANQQTTSNQGYAVLRTGATIEHARTGLLAARGDPNNPFSIIKESTGGIIQATDAIFRNNRYDAVLPPYENRNASGNPIANRSFFTRTWFSTQGDLNNAGLYPMDHVAMLGTRGINFKGCAFSNSLVGTNYQLPFQQGHGIRSIGSSFTVSNDCLVTLPYPNPCPPQQITNSGFSNLHYGIVATTVDPGRTFSVSDATFTGTNYCIRMEGIQDAALHRNTFNVPEPFIPGIIGAVYGVYADQCTGYSIQENTFLTAQPTGLYQKVGLVIKDSGTLYNTFYNNTFNNLYAGSLIQGKNARVDGSVGLEVKCNDYGLEQMNGYDVALTGLHVYIQNKQGSAILNPTNPAELKNPAGNRFSVDHHPTPPYLEADWHVQNTSTLAEYFHHTPTFGNRTLPLFRDPDWIQPSDQNSFWPENRTLACPSRLTGGGPVVKREMAEQEHAEYTDSKTAYDATKDDGDTYTLLGYVGDPGHSSAQVRNALQSVAPKVGTEVWQAAFERSPTMNAWHITQALLSNSPLQSEVLRMVDFYTLPGAYADLVYATQNGEVNILSLLQGDMARHAGAKAEALTDLGRMAWLDSLDLGTSLDSLLLVHDALPADNHALARSGVLAAQGDYSTLEALADAEAMTSETPELYDVLKHFATAQQGSGWNDTANVDVAWLQQLGAQRDVIGSAQANAWLHALGHDLPEEIIILPEEGPKSMNTPRNKPAMQWETGIILEVFPNPSNGAAHALYEVPEGMGNAELRLMDVHGRLLHSQRLGDGPGLIPLNTSGLAAGVYLAELRIDDRQAAQTKVVIQR